MEEDKRIRRAYYRIISDEIRGGRKVKKYRTEAVRDEEEREEYEAKVGHLKVSEEYGNDPRIDW